MAGCGMCLAVGCARLRGVPSCGVALLRGARLGCVCLAGGDIRLRVAFVFHSTAQSALCGCLGVWSRLGTGTLRSPPDERAGRGVLPRARGWSGTSWSGWNLPATDILPGTPHGASSARGASTQWVSQNIRDVRPSEGGRTETQASSAQHSPHPITVSDKWQPPHQGPQIRISASSLGFTICASGPT